MSKKTDKAWQYLFKLPSNIYNNENKQYELNSLRNSEQERVIIFAGKSRQNATGVGVLHIYLELSVELTDGNIFSNLQRLLNLVYLETGLPTYYVPIQVSEGYDFDKVLATYSSDSFYYPDRSYSGSANKPNHLVRVKTCVSMVNRLNEENFEKFDNALNTYIWALELRELPNPHLKYTLYMTLFLSVINQLASNPEFCENHPICEKCGKELSHQLKGERQAIEELMKELLTGEALAQGISKFKKLYSHLRSEFLHSGKLSGKEKGGGFLFDFRGSDNLVIDEMELLIACRQLLEQFLLKRQKQS